LQLPGGQRRIAAVATLSTAADVDRAQYERDGYLILDSIGLEEAVVDGAVFDLAGRYGGEGREEGGVTYYWHRIQDAWRISANVRAIALAETVHRLLEGLYERRPLPFQTLNFQKGSEQAVHSDTLHFNSVPKGFMCAVWVALEDIDMENGPVVYYPGSHELPEITMADVGVRASQDDYPAYERFISDLIEERGLEPLHATIKKGQALLWSANLLHGGIPHRDPARTRHSQVTHFYFEGCRYYTPMLSDEERTQWREPTWISAEAAEAVEPYDVEAIRAAADSVLPRGVTVAIVTKGDDRLLDLPDRRCWHFPQDEDGSHAGWYPANDADAISQLERLRARGADHVLFPRPAFWWLDHYAGLRRHLEAKGGAVRHEECIAFRLGGGSG
jgi:hypothetical protein